MKRKRKTFRIKCFQTRSDIEHVKLILGLAGFFSVLVSHIRRERDFTQDNLPGHCRPAQKDKQLFALTLATPDNWEWPVTWEPEEKPCRHWESMQTPHKERKVKPTALSLSCNGADHCRCVAHVSIILQYKHFLYSVHCPTAAMVVTLVVTPTSLRIRTSSSSL